MPDINLEKPDFDIPQISTQQMIEVDRLMIDYYGITLFQMMENAGLNLARLALKYSEKSDTFLILAGSGGNGGGTLVAARRLIGWGKNVKIRLSKNIEQYHGVPAHQLYILQQLNADIKPFMQNEHFSDNIILDGIIGYSINGAPRGVAAQMIEMTNGSNATVISLDTPSGIELTEGIAYHPSVKSDATLTLALPKKGLFKPLIKNLVNQLYLADIGVPLQLYKKMGIDLKENPFKDSEIVRLY
jgi:NAD(P)H-hydrate epimerase